MPAAADLGFKHILVPVDLSDESRTPLQQAARLASLAGGRVTLLHVIESIDDLPEDEVEDFYRALEQRAEATLTRWADDLQELGIEFERVVVLGKRGAEVIRYAEEQQVDLVVMGSRPVRPEQPGPGFGTISQQVALFARCPVLLLR